MDKKTVLVTGSSSGIGYATAQLFCDNGYFVVGIDKLPAQLVHRRYRHYTVDIRDKDNLPEVSNIGHLILNAGVLYDIEDTIGTNIYGTFNCEDVYVRPNLKTLESIVILSSIAAHDGQDDRGYVASKGALISYTRYLANQLAPFGVRVNSLSPGAGRTNMNEKYIRDAGVYEAVAQQNLLKRWNEPEECAKAIYFFAVDATFCTGQDLLIDGGERIYTRYVYGIDEDRAYPVPGGIKQW